jgi:hypothetical protein
VSAAAALARTVDLVRADVFPDATPEEIVASLTGVRLRLVSDERNVSSVAGQTALITTAIVAAQSGVRVVLDLPDVPVLKNQPPVRSGGLVEGLLDVTGDLITPGCREDGEVSDLTVVMGSTPYRTTAGAIARLAPTPDGFEVVPGAARSALPWEGELPFRALFGGVAAGSEGFRAAMRRLSQFGHKSQLEHATRDVRGVRLRLPEPKDPSALRSLDVISAGAITHGMLFALLRVSGLDVAVRIFDDDLFDWPNLNRYMLGRRSVLEAHKAALLADYSRPGLSIRPIRCLFDQDVASRVALAETVAVGVDDIPSRWRVQRVAPGRVVVGATSHFEVVVSEHLPGTPCAGCLYRNGEDDGRPIPTVSFVSAFSGILQAYLLLSRSTGARQIRAAPVNLAGSEPLSELGVQRRRWCPVGCTRAQSVVTPEHAQQ